MWHVAVLAQPISGLHLRARMVEHPSCGYQPFRLWVFTPLGNQHLSVLVVGLLAVVAEEIDAGGKEVDGRGLEDLVAATAAFLLAFLQGFMSVEPADGQIGVGVFVPDAEGVKTTSDQKHGLVFKKVKSGETFTYYSGSCWSKGDIQSSEKWFEMLNKLK